MVAINNNFTMSERYSTVPDQFRELVHNKETLEGVNLTEFIDYKKPSKSSKIVRFYEGEQPLETHLETPSLLATDELVNLDGQIKLSDCYFSDLEPFLFQAIYPFNTYLLDWYMKFVGIVPEVDGATYLQDNIFDGLYG